MHNCISTFLLFLDTFILEPLHFIFLPLQFGFVLFGLNQNLDVQLMWRPWHPNFNIHFVCFFEIGTKCLTEAPRHEPKLVRIRVAASPLYSIQLVYSKKLGCVKFPRGQREPRRGITQPIFAFYTSTLLHSAIELALSPFPVGSFAFPLRQSDVRLRVRSNAAITGGRSQRDTHKPEPSGGHTLKNA